MATLPDFEPEPRFSKRELEARYHLTASDAESLSLGEPLALAVPEAASAPRYRTLWKR